MDVKGNVSFFDDDDEIIGMLSKLPLIEGFDGMTVLKFMQEKAKKQDFATVFCHNNYIYTIYKFDVVKWGVDDSGLLLSISPKSCSMEHANYWLQLKTFGLPLTDKLLGVILSGLARFDFL